MRNFMKILLILFILFLSCAYVCNVHASDVNMNLSAENDSTTYGSTPSSNNNDSSNNNSQQNSSVTVTNPSEVVLDALTVSDMINIILCAIGIILILLGIAIIIRQKLV